MTGFGTTSKRAELLVNQPATVNFSLTIQASTVTVDVSGQAQTLNDSDATIGNALNNATIKALPSEGRNVPDLLSIQPGVLYLARRRQAKRQPDRFRGRRSFRSDQRYARRSGRQ